MIYFVANWKQIIRCFHLNICTYYISTTDYINYFTIVTFVAVCFGRTLESKTTMIGVELYHLYFFIFLDVLSDKIQQAGSKRHEII